jgi:hypothetical protein
MEKLKLIKHFFIMFIVQLVLYLLLVINFRAVAQANMLWSVVSDSLIASMNFMIIRKIAKSEDSWTLFTGYTAGSAAGSVLGIILSKLLLHS